MADDSATIDTIDRLLKGFGRFRDEHFAERSGTYKQLIADGQKPDVALIACSDSRVDPAIVFQAEPGELFAIRNVANLVPPYEADEHSHGTSAALEYAVEHLKVRHIVVLGHKYCGGIESLVTADAADDEQQQFIRPWMAIVERAHHHVQETMPDASTEEQTRACEKAAVLVSLENLETFPFVRDKVRAGTLALHGCFIDIAEGELFVYDREIGEFRPAGK